jgi:hypothetical protein
LRNPGAGQAFNQTMRRLLPIAAVLACLLPAAQAAAATDLELAVQDDPVLLTHAYGDSAIALDRAQAMGAKRIRVNLRWAYSMPKSERTAKHAPHAVDWDFSDLARLLAAADAHAMKLQVTLTGPAPAFATRSHRVGNNGPSARYFAAFVRAAVTRFGGLGSVDRWSIWNEPNWHSQLAPASRAPRVYRKLYVAGYAAIKRLQPSDQVLIGELMPGANRTRSMPALRFLRGVASHGTLYADGFALHPYNFAAAPKKAHNPNPDIVEMGSLSRLERQLDRLRAHHLLRTPSNARMPVYLTEFGYQSAGPLAVTASTHAKWLTQAWYIAKRDPRVKQLLQYELIDPWPKKVTWRSAVLTRTGAPTPAYDALRKLASSG